MRMIMKKRYTYLFMSVCAYDYEKEVYPPVYECVCAYDFVCVHVYEASCMDIKKVHMYIYIYIYIYPVIDV